MSGKTVLERKIELELQSPSCTVMGPSFYDFISYPDTTHEQRTQLLQTLQQEKKETLDKLKSKISEQMMTMFSSENDKKNILYLDTSQKNPQENIMLFFLRKVGELYHIPEEELLEQIKEYSSLSKKEYHTIDEYNQHLKDVISEREKAQTRTNINLKKIITNSEGTNYHRIIEDILKKLNKDSIQVFLDNIETLTELEQQQINNFLSTQGTISRNVQAYIKINNGTQQWKTRRAAHGKFVLPTHDYRSWTATIKEIESE